MKRKFILIFTILSLFIQCKKSKTETLKDTKIEQLFAENNYDLGGNVKFELFSDSTYNFTSIVKSPNYEKTEKFNGFCEVKNDTLYIVNFWATWCKPCVEELPNFELLAKNYQNKKVKMYLVTTDMRKDIATRVTDFVKAKGLTQQVIFINEIKIGLIFQSLSDLIVKRIIEK